MNISPRHLIFTLLLGGLLTACKQEAVVPTDSRPATAALQMYPDYRDVTPGGGRTGGRKNRN